MVCAGDVLGMVAAATFPAGRVQKSRDKPSVCELVRSLILPIVNDLSGGKEEPEGKKARSWYQVTPRKTTLWGCSPNISNILHQTWDPPKIRTSAGS